MADTALTHDVVFPPLNARQKADLRAALGPKVALANPLDYHTYVWANRSAMAACFAAMLDPGLALSLVVLDFPRGDRCPAPDWDLVIEAVAEAMAETGLPMAILSSLPETMPENIASGLMARGIVPLSGMDDSLTAVEVAAALGRGSEAASVLLPGPDGPTWVLSEAEAKAALAAHGVTVPFSERATTPQGAAEAARRIGTPVALKGEGFAHKTEAGAVRLNLSSSEAVLDAAEAMAADTYLVEEMVGGGVAELLVGVVRDPAHGFVLTLGAGGTFTELLDDTASLLLPVTELDIRAALNRLRLAPRLAGYRSAPAADIPVIAKAVLAVQDYVTSHAETVHEVEINPLICTPTRAVAADALIRLRETQ